LASSRCQESTGAALIGGSFVLADLPKGCRSMRPFISLHQLMMTCRLSGKSESSARTKNFSLSYELKSLLSPLRSVPSAGGALRDRHECRARNAMDAMARRTKREWSRTAKPCGPDAPTLAFKSVMMLRITLDDGGKKARSPRRARRKPLKPSRREGRLNPPLPVATTLVCFFTCTRGRGCGGHPVFPAPSDWERRMLRDQLGRKRAAGRLACGLRFV